MKTLKIYDNMRIEISKVSDNIGIIKQYETIRGYSQYFPRVGLRFGCGRLDTNIVAIIIESNPTGGKFITLSGSIYEWTLLEEGVFGKELYYEMSDNVRESINDFILNKKIN